LLVVAGIASAASGFLVFQKTTGRLSVGLWLAALAALAAACLVDRAPRGVRRPWSWRRTVLVLAVLLLGPAVRWFLTEPHRVHGDELITGYFSVSEDLSAKRFFAEIPADKGQWVCQFPPLFWVIQKEILKVVGDDIRGLRISIYPYIFLTGVFLFLVTRRLLGERTAYFAVVLSAFFAWSLYLETLALMFVSSTVALLAFFLFALRSTSDEGRPKDALAMGGAAAFCYLLYSSSYVALGLLGVFLLAWAFRRPLAAVKRGLLAALGFAIVICPYGVYALRFHNYFLGRIDQVSLLHGQWSPGPQKMKEGMSAAGVVLENLALSLKALEKDGVGGQGGYFFGKNAFFEPFSAALFLAGCGLTLLFLKRVPRLAFVHLVILVSFLSGVVMTIPPPALHRLSGTFPFVAIVLALPLHVFWEMTGPSRAIKVAVTAGVLTLFAGLNVRHFSKGTMAEFDPPEFQLAAYLNSHYPNRKLYVAAYPGNAYEKLAYFAVPRRGASALTGFHVDLIRDFRRDEPYLYVVLFAGEFEKKFRALDPSARWVEYAPGWGLFVNLNEPEPSAPISGDTAVLHPSPCPAALAPGLSMQTFPDNKFGTKPSGTEVRGSPGFACAANAYENKSMTLVYSGWLRVDRAGTFQLRMTSDDASSLTLGTNKVIDVKNAGDKRTAKVAAEAGCYELSLRYQNDLGPACLTLDWSTDGGRTFGPMPAAMFAHAP
jgi:hypothetical protein